MRPTGRNSEPQQDDQHDGQRRSRRATAATSGMNHLSRFAVNVKTIPICLIRAERSRPSRAAVLGHGRAVSQSCARRAAAVPPGRARLSGVDRGRTLALLLRWRSACRSTCWRRRVSSACRPARAQSARRDATGLRPYGQAAARASMACW